MAELNKIEFKYAANGIEQSIYRSVNGTDIGHYIIDASNYSFITHKKKFNFMRLNDLYTTNDTYILDNFALSVRGANNLYNYIISSRYDDSTNLLQKVSDVSQYFNARLNKLIAGDAQTSVNKVIDTFNELESFLSNISDTSTLTDLLKDIYDYVDASVLGAKRIISNTQSDLNNLLLSVQNDTATINTNIFNISTNINSSINRAIGTINTNIDDLNDRLTTIEVGGGTGGGGTIDPEALKNYVQFKDLKDENIKTQFIDPRTSTIYKLNEILSAFAEPYIVNASPAEILYDNAASISVTDTSAILGAVFNRPTVMLSGAIKLNAHDDVTPLIESGTITGTITYRKLKSNRIETEEKTYTVSKDFTVTTSNGISSFSTNLTFDSMPTLYYGEDGDDNTVVSVATSIKQLKATYPAKNLNITTGIIKGNNNQNIIISLDTPQTIEVPETILYLGKNTSVINITSFTPAYYILREDIITSFVQRSGIAFNPLYPLDINTEGYYYYYVLLPTKFTYETLKLIYKGTAGGAESTYKLIPTNFSMNPVYVMNVTREMVLYVAVNAQNKPVKLQTANGGSIKIIL